jgi:hypothetical protein
MSGTRTRVEQTNGGQTDQDYVVGVRVAFLCAAVQRIPVDLHAGTRVQSYRAGDIMPEPRGDPQNARLHGAGTDGRNDLSIDSRSERSPATLKPHGRLVVEVTEGGMPGPAPRTRYSRSESRKTSI